MKQYMYTVQPVRIAMLYLPDDEEKQYLEQHQAYQQRLVESGTGVIGGALTVRDSRQFGLLIFQAEDDDTAKEIMLNDPAVESRVMRGRLFPFRVSLWNADACEVAGSQEHYLYIIQPARPEMLSEQYTEFEASTMQSHFLYLKDLTEKGHFCCAGPCLNTDYSNFGLGVLRAGSIESAWKISEHDPAVQNRVMRLDVQPFELNFINKGFHHAR